MVDVSTPEQRAELRKSARKFAGLVMTSHDQCCNGPCLTTDEGSGLHDMSSYGEANFAADLADVACAVPVLLDEVERLTTQLAEERKSHEFTTQCSRENAGKAMRAAADAARAVSRARAAEGELAHLGEQIRDEYERALQLCEQNKSVGRSTLTGLYRLSLAAGLPPTNMTPTDG